MKKKSLAIATAMVFVLSLHSVIFAYDGKTHSKICEAAADNSQLDLILKDMLGFENGTETVLQNGKKTEPVWKWIAYGGKAEDFGKNGENDVWSTRAYNHFHDPLEDWADARFNNPVNINYLLRYGRHPVSSILWGLYPGMQDFSQNTTGDWSWIKARDYYYNALSGLTRGEIDQNYADCFRALGQLIHLLQDASVPAHTRNDLHIFPLYKIPFTNIELDKPFGRWTYETYTKENINNLDYTPDKPSDDLLADPNPDPNYNSMVPVSGLFDRNMYNEGSPIPASNAAIGLAEYSNANFLSQDTIWTYQHPSLDDTNYATIDWLNPTPVIAEDGKSDNRIYIRKTAGEPINHLAAADYWSYEYVDDINTIESPFLLDKKCWEDYAEKLVPHAVGYSAGLLDYFFRGKLEVSALPLFSENASYGLRLKIKNVTPTQEAMIKGAEDQFALVCRYTPDGANPDGSEDKFVTAVSYNCREGNCDEIQYDDEVTIDFYLPWEEDNRIGIQIYESAKESVKCMLVFKGKLGEEEAAVAGKYFTLGQDQIRFTEEWDNGLTGNYAWEHISSSPDNGSASNIVENGILTKDNIRVINHDTARYNESYFDFESAENPDGLLVTPESYLEFKIDEMSIDASNPDIHWQALHLIFNNGLTLQMSQEGQNNYPSSATYLFNPGANTVENIYSLFENVGIEIPGPLYLKSIDFIQQLYEVQNHPEGEDIQHMEVDSIRIIEEKQEE